MARGQKQSPSSKGRFQQALKKTVAREVARLRHRPRSPEQHEWLVRHFERQNGHCAYCGIPMHLPTARGRDDRLATLDHVVPLALGGADSEANTAAACRACNEAKADTNAQSYRASAFCIARKAFAATVPEPVRKTVVVTVRKRPRPPP